MISFYKRNVINPQKKNKHDDGNMMKESEMGERWWGGFQLGEECELNRAWGDSCLRCSFHSDQHNGLYTELCLFEHSVQLKV